MSVSKVNKLLLPITVISDLNHTPSRLDLYPTELRNV